VDVSRLLVGLGAGDNNCRTRGQHSIFRAGLVESAGTLELQVGPHLFSWSTEALRRIYYDTIPRRMQHPDVDRTAGE
jgi:hypothetical protein